MKSVLNNHKIISKAGMSPYLSLTTLNVNCLNSPIKKYRLAELILKIKTQLAICSLQETQFAYNDTQTESEGIEKIPCK